MDNLISTVTKTFQQNDTNSLLQNQQISQDKINKLLEQSADALMCGPDCQKKRKEEELKQKLLDAQTNVQTAPHALVQARQNYYVAVKGEAYYDNMEENELKKNVNSISTQIGNNFNDELKNSITMNEYLNTAIINTNYTKELLNEYIEKNRILKEMLKDKYGDILTNDRKTYYETDALSWLEQWYRFWWYVYYMLVVVLIVSFLKAPNDLTMAKKVGISIIFIFYPYYISYIVDWTYGLLSSVYKNMPKNVYNDL